MGLSSSMTSTPTGPMLTPVSGQKQSQLNTSSTFATFQKAAKEKADRDRILREQQEINRKTIERKEKEGEGGGGCFRAGKTNVVTVIKDLWNSFITIIIINFFNIIFSHIILTIKCPISSFSPRLTASSICKSSSCYK